MPATLGNGLVVMAWIWAGVSPVGLGTLTLLSVMGRWWPMSAKYPTVSTFWPNCFSTMRLNWSTDPDFRSGCTAEKPRLALVGLGGPGAVGTGMPAARLAGAPAVAGVLPQATSPSVVSICVATSDAQVGLKEEVKGGFLSAALEV